MKNLTVIERLDVGPVRMERRRATATYTVTRAGKRASIDLIYRFEEDVFGDDASSRNLAAMMTAQVALNYGLFCKRIVFHGEFDEHDRRFLETFAENTAREIWVHKLLKENPFLTEGFVPPPTPKNGRFLRASIRFAGGAAAGRTAAWSVDASRHAVLSSGGKDSLLTFGLLDELGRETHPIFVNESGRHWYTALNGYRHLARNHSATARVWTNSDRVFSWMLRQLPLVRPDFARLRSDEYPIRLWTVAVFLFGALPLLRKRRIGRLLVGDEYDTTVRASHQGIRHYGGLYDQSRLFDEEMTRYFLRKGWGVCQFSVLRPLSELLIQKMLAERYPRLLRQQVSCHAAHIDGNRRVRPCGACEKCRRIVAMLTAVGADPASCGYTAEQTRECLERIASRGVHQEAEGAQHLAFMLQRGGKLPAATAAFSPRAHPEVLSLRFHPLRSPAEAIPAELREALYGIYLEHADGALQRNGRSWEPLDLADGDHLTKPYRFEKREAAVAPSRNGTTYLLAEMTWPQAEEAFKRVDVAMLPVGAIEQHGPHLPLDTDAFDADYLARRVAESCSEPRPLVLPCLAYGVSYHHQDFSGTLSVSPETQARIVYEIGLSAARCGITKLVIVNGHGGNAPALHLAAQMINRDAHIFTCVDTGETSDADVAELIETPNDVHAGEIETSTAMANRPQLVHPDRAPKMVPRFSSRFLNFTTKRSVGWYAYTEKISSTGVMGDATRATAAKGEKIWDVMTLRLVELIEDLKRLSLEEIYQKRY